MELSRANPSPRYRHLNQQYRALHADGDRLLNLPSETVFPGKSLFPHIHRIRQLITSTRAANLLDYGCGKGFQYDPLGAPAHGLQAGDSLMDFWDVDNIHLYDPCHPPFDTLPTGRFDGVISTDVLEHCPEEDLPWILDEIFAFAKKFVFANVACFPARRRLPDGENAHCTIQGVEWWQQCLGAAAARHPHIVWEVWLQYLDPDQTEVVINEVRVGNSGR